MGATFFIQVFSSILYYNSNGKATHKERERERQAVEIWRGIHEKTRFSFLYQIVIPNEKVDVVVCECVYIEDWECVIQVALVTLGAATTD